MAPIDTVSGGPLSPAQYGELALANQRAATIRKAAKVAAFNGWMLAIFAGLSAPFAYSSLDGIVVVVGLAIIAYLEFQGRKRLLRFDPAVATLLGWNQIALLTLVVAYCAWNLFTGLTGTSPLAAELKANPDLAAALGSVGGIDRIYKLLVVAVYGSVIVVSAIFQGWNAAYYFTRREHVEAYVRDTPPWIMDIQRTMAVA